MDYSGPFDPGFHLGKLSREALARLGREYLLVGHIHDRALMPIVASRFGPEAMTEIAIDEWMGSSPIYNERNRKLLGIEGDGVSTIFKGLQLDVGAPHQYMDFRYEVVDEALGYFWLDYCGAYEDVSAAARGKPEPIVQMCHHMEDPTFDATVMAVNPLARCRAVHRPPLQIGHSGPVCRWRVSIAEEHGAGVVEEREIARAVRRSRAARFEHPALSETGTGGLDDYAGPFEPDFSLEQFSRPALARQCAEFALDVHLLVRAAHLAIERRWGEAARREIARDHWAGAAPIYAERIRAAMGIEGDDMGSILKTLQLDPAFPPGYADVGCELVDERRGRFWIRECDALADDEPRGWLSVLDEDAPGFLELAAAVNPRVQCRALSKANAAHSWELWIDESAEPHAPSPWVKVARLSTATGFQFRARTSPDRKRSPPSS